MLSLGPSLLSFVVPGLPIAQPRPHQRFVDVPGGPFGTRRVVRRFVPADEPIHAWRAAIQLVSANAMRNREILSGPLALTAHFYFPRPSSKIWAKKPMIREPHITKPDMSNLLKALEDSMNRIVWKDDSSVCLEILSKSLVAKGELPRTEVTVSSVVV